MARIIKLITSRSGARRNAKSTLSREQNRQPIVMFDKKRTQKKSFSQLRSAVVWGKSEGTQKKFNQKANKNRYEKLIKRSLFVNFI